MTLADVVLFVFGEIGAVTIGVGIGIAIAKLAGWL